MRIAITMLAVMALGCGTKEHAKESSDQNKPTGKETKEAKEGKEAAEGPKKDTAIEHGDGDDPKEHSKQLAEHSEATRVELKNDEAAKLAGFEVVKALDRPEGAGIVVTASIAFDATKRAVINARAPGIVRAIKHDVGSKVDSGTALAVIESAQVGADRSRIGGAKTRVFVAEASYKRETELQNKGIAAMKDVLAAQQELEAARSEYASLNASLGAVGQSAGGGGYTLATPIAGVVVTRAASIGKLVGVEETLFEVVDTSTMWAEIDVPEDQLTTVAVSQPVVITVDGLPGRAFAGAISYVSPQIDPKTRTARARAALPNLDGALRANMFARARIVIGGGKSTVTIPSQAVQRIGDDSAVFVRISERVFEMRTVDLGADDGSTVEVTGGLRGGEEVVAQGAFLLKSEMLKGSLKGDDD